MVSYVNGGVCVMVYGGVVWFSTRTGLRFSVGGGLTVAGGGTCSLNNSCIAAKNKGFIAVSASFPIKTQYFLKRLKNSVYLAISSGFDPTVDFLGLISLYSSISIFFPFFQKLKKGSNLSQARCLSKKLWNSFHCAASSLNCSLFDIVYSRASNYCGFICCDT